MDPILHGRVKRQLEKFQLECAKTAISNTSSTYNYRNPRSVVEYIEANVAPLDELWRSVAANLAKLKINPGARKSAAQAQVSYSEAVHKFEQIQYDRLGGTPELTGDGKVDKKARRKVVKDVLKLIDKALVYCPTKSVSTGDNVPLAALFSLRAAALLEFEKPSLALVAANRALSLAPDSRSAHAHKAAALMALDRVPEAYRLLKHYFRRTCLYPREREEREARDKQSLSPPFWAANCMELIYEERLRHLLWDVSEQLSKQGEDDEGEVSDNEEDDGCLSEPEADAYDKPFEESKKCFSFDYRCIFKPADECKGRFIVAGEDIAEGTLIFRERAYSMVMLEEAQLNYCHYCGRNVQNRFLPCSQCAQSIYCGEACAQADRKLSHRLECGLVGYWGGKSKSTFHVFRLLNRLGVGEVLRAIDEHTEEQQQQQPSFDAVDYRYDETLRCTREVEKDSEALRRTYRAQMTLLDHSDKFEVDSLAYNMTNAIECALMACIVQGVEFAALTREQLIELISHCFISIRRILTNAFRWSEYDAHGTKVHIATCYQLMASMFNHSCVPCAEWSIHTGNLHIRTTRDISAGEEITVSYGPSAEEDYFEARQERLLSGYYFRCNCTACVADARYVLALQCTNCPGPVLADKIEQDGHSKDTVDTAHCLLCFKPYPGNSEKDAFRRLAVARTNLEFYCQLWPHACGTKPNEANKQLASIKTCLGEIESLIYRRSVLWVQSIYAACKVFHQKGLLGECMHYGGLIDAILPLRGLQLIALPSPKSATEPYEEAAVSGDQLESNEELQQEHAYPSSLYSSSSAFLPNIDHMIFWVSAYKSWLIDVAKGKEVVSEEAHSSLLSDRAQVWCQLERYYKRLHKLIKWAYELKKDKLEALTANNNNNTEEETLTIAALSEQISVLELLDSYKSEELRRLKERYGVVEVQKKMVEDEVESEGYGDTASSVMPDCN